MLTQPQFAGRRMATVLPRNRGLKTCGHQTKTRDSVPFRYASAATLTQYPHSSVPYLMLWGACAKRHCKSWQTQKRIPPPCCGLGESVIFCTIAVMCLFRRIREIRVQKTFLRIPRILREDRKSILRNLREAFTGRAWWRDRLLSPRRVRAAARRFRCRCRCRCTLRRC